MSMHEVFALGACLVSGGIGYVGARIHERMRSRRIERETWKAASVFYARKMAEVMEDQRWVTVGHHMAKQMANVMGER